MAGDMANMIAMAKIGRYVLDISAMLLFLAATLLRSAKVDDKLDDPIRNWLIT